MWHDRFCLFVCLFKQTKLQIKLNESELHVSLTNDQDNVTDKQTARLLWQCHDLAPTSFSTQPVAPTADERRNQHLLNKSVIIAPTTTPTLNLMLHVDNTQASELQQPNVRSFIISRKLGSIFFLFLGLAYCYNLLRLQHYQ